MPLMPCAAAAIIDAFDAATLLIITPAAAADAFTLSPLLPPLSPAPG
jgi:hypothetical protein